MNKEVSLKDIEEATVRYVAAQKVIDSMEPTELEKQFAKKIEEYLEKEK